MPRGLACTERLRRGILRATGECDVHTLRSGQLSAAGGTSAVRALPGGLVLPGRRDGRNQLCKRVQYGFERQRDMRQMHARHFPGGVGRDSMRDVPSRLVLRRRVGGAAAVPERQLLERDRPLGRGQLHGVYARALVLDGQHRADAVCGRHGDG